MKFRYYIDLRIHTLSIPSMSKGRVYVINVLDLVLAVQRQCRDHLLRKITIRDFYIL